jgi:hypothetical protein
MLNYPSLLRAGASFGKAPRSCCNSLRYLCPDCTLPIRNPHSAIYNGKTRRHDVFSCIAVAIVLFFLSPIHALGTNSPYPGITPRQHILALGVMHEFFAHHWATAESTACEMRAMESSEGLLPLSSMLRFATRAWRILNNEFDSRAQGDMLNRELAPLRIVCLDILHKRHFADSTLPTRMFIEAGINGFDATLIIRSKPLVSLKEGLESFRTLDSVRTMAPQMKDVYLGLGLFQCALANEPSIIGFAIHLFGGLKVSLDSGLVYLRMCANDSTYTRNGAREYLIQFLSPFIPAEAAEKQSVFRSLEAEFPKNPYYVFQEIDERMAFHRKQVFSRAVCLWAANQIPGFDSSNSFMRTYANCVRWQCSTIDPSLAPALKPRPFMQKEALSFYPAFLNAAKAKYLIESDSDVTRREERIDARLFHHQRNLALSILRKSEIHPMLREYFLWHLEDGLR